MININLAIRQKDEEEAASYLLRIGKTNGCWFCVILNNDDPELSKIVIRRYELNDITDELSNYIKSIGVIIYVCPIKQSLFEIRDMLLLINNLRCKIE